MEEDFEENQKNLSNSFQEIEKNIDEKQNSKKRFLKFAFALFLIIAIFSGTVFVYENYLNPKAKLAKEQQKNYEKYLQMQANYEKAMKEDTYGGKTPEETLKLFIDALKKEDFDLASKYFVLNYSGIVDPKYKEALIKAKNEGKIEKIIDLLSRAKPDP
ncbi:MAG: hypothetical protein N2Z85_02760, partial [Patescibacteria group bacterium]|nr:hypothetical protein [Patescibacteria group bacterium]